MDSSFTSSSPSRFFASAVFNASSMISLALSSALPIFCSIPFLHCAEAISAVTGTAISRVTIAVITIGTIIPGAPPYLIFIVQYQL
jgi:hypothetical protein